MLKCFGAIQSEIEYCGLKSVKKSQIPYFGSSKFFEVIDIGTAGKLVSSACYDMQQGCV